MLAELRVENLGVIAELSLTLGPGMTVVTGETGTGKTLVVEAIELLTGARADAGLVRAGADEARVEARFHLPPAALQSIIEGEDLDLECPDGELVLSRVIPAEGRSRASVNGRLVPAATLTVLGRHLVELHGQHAHQALLTPRAHRDALDHFAGDAALDAKAAYRAARARLHELEEALRSVGGDERERAREVELLRYQLEEIDAAGIDDPEEERRLEADEALLADASAHRHAGEAAFAALAGPVLDALGEAAAVLADRAPYEELERRVRVLQDEVGDVERAVRMVSETIEEDPERLAAVQERRRLLADLRRKYGEHLADVLRYRGEIADRLETLVHAEDRARELVEERSDVREQVVACGRRLSAARASGAPALATAIEEVLHELAMPSAEIEVAVRQRPGAEEDLPEDGFDDVEILLSANRGEPVKPLARVASGGELARTMLAARVVLSAAPPTIVFDEVDAGIGGQAGVAVGRKLGLVAREHQVLCVTHLAQVAAFADQHVVVDKTERDGRTVADVAVVDGEGRVAELSRMLAGDTGEAAREHAEELLASALGPDS